MVVQMLKTSPSHVRAMIDGKMGERKASKVMELGILFDRALLEPDLFKEGVTHWVVPKHITSLNHKAGRDWRRDHPDLFPLKWAELEDIKGMIESVMRHKLARRIIEESSKQESAFAIHKDTGLLRKCRPDARMVENQGRLLLVDLKSTFIGGAMAEVWSAHCARMNYHIQDVFYSDIYKDLAGEDPFYIFLVVERRPPYAVRIFDIHEEGRDWARDKYRRALDRFQQCKATGLWPAYPETIERIRLPKWELSPPEVIVDV